MSHRIQHGARAADVIGKFYMQVANALFRDPRISPKAKGVFGYMWSHEDGFGLTIERIAEAMGVGVSMISSALKELEKYGYLVRRRFRNDDGTWNSDTIYELTDMPNGLNIVAEAPYDGEGNRRSEPTRENRTLEGSAENPRSEPTCDFPSLDNPSLENRGSKKNNLENSLPPSGGERRAHDARTRANSAPAPEVSSDSAGPSTLDARTATQPVVKVPKQRGGMLPDDWEPSADMLARAAEKYPGIDLDEESFTFTNHFVGNTKFSRTADGWNRAWWNWVLRSWKRAGSPKTPTPTSPSAQVGLFDTPADHAVVADEIASVWLAHWRNQGGTVLPETDRKLRSMLVGALQAGATPEKVRAALVALREPCPAPFRFQDELLGVRPAASGGGVSRQEREQQARSEQTARSMQRAMEREARGETSADDSARAILASVLGTAGLSGEQDSTPGPAASPPWAILRGEIAR